MNSLDRFGQPRDQLRLVADHAPFIIWVSDAAGYCRYVNPEWTRFTGQPLSETGGHGWSDMIHHDDRLSAAKAFREASSQQQPATIRYRLHHVLEGFRWVTCVAQPHFVDERCVGYVGTVSTGLAPEDTEPEQNRLTMREREVMQLTAYGKTSEEVGAILGISPRTAEVHIAHAMRKTNAVNRVQAVVEAIRTGQITP